MHTVMASDHTPSDTRHAGHVAHLATRGGAGWSGNHCSSVFSRVAVYIVLSAPCLHLPTRVACQFSFLQQQQVVAVVVETLVALFLCSA